MRMKGDGTQPRRPAAFPGIAADAIVHVMIEISRFITMRERAACPSIGGAFPVHV